MTIKNNILIVDDTPANLKVLSSMLIKKGYRPRPAISGKVALKAVQSEIPDLILLDIGMPDMDGYEVCKQLKKNPDTSAVPIIFISALDSIDNKVRAFETGGVDYITKPFQVEEVLARVESHLELCNLRQDLQEKNYQLEQAQGELKAHIHELSILNQHMQTELALAHEIQTSLLPPPTPKWPCLDVVCYTSPVQDVGGDFYNYHIFDNHHYALAVGDISGKGISAALLMTLSLASFDMVMTHPTTSPDQRMASLDELITPYTEPRKKNCAMCYVELEIKHKEQTRTSHTNLSSIIYAILHIVNAGCVPPYIKCANGDVTFEEVGGFALGQGLGTKFGYQQHTLELQPGDMIILTSDGVVEANNIDNEMFGFERLEQIVRDGPDIGNAEAMLDHLKQEIFAFTGSVEQNDDITIVVIQI